MIFFIYAGDGLAFAENIGEVTVGWSDDFALPDQ